MAKMRTKKEIQDKLRSIQEDLEVLKTVRKAGFTYPEDHRSNTHQIKVRQVLIVGLQWTLGENFNIEPLYGDE